MTRPEPGGRTRLPGPDVPSAEVLDELLRAFAVDVTDEARLQRVDLTSPEVVELLSGGTPAPPTDESEPASTETAVDVQESEPEPADPVDAAAVSDGALEPVAGAEDVAGGEDVAPEAVDHRHVSITANGNASEPVVAAPTGPRTIVITDHHHETMEVAAGDPLLAAAAAAAETEALPLAAVKDGRVFIDDTSSTGVADAISLEEAVTATRIEPRRRERRKAVKRAAGRKRLKWFLLFLGVVVIVVGALAVLGSGLFAIEDVEVDGAERTDEDALAAVIEQLRGTPVLRVDTDAAEAALEAIAWVEDARVTTQFPHGARIELRERTPMATYAGADGQFRLIDTDGRVLEVLDEQPADRMLVTSDAAPDLAAGTYAPTGFRAAASLIQALTPEMRGLAESVAVTADGSDLRLLLTEGIEVRFGASQELVAKLVRLQTWLDIGRDGAVRTVDVSTDEVTTSQ